MTFATINLSLYTFKKSMRIAIVTKKKQGDRAHEK